ncbi:MAG: DNA-processing protein DprA [Gallionella sp.]|nr:DNA-processing protein DprA [Gallionella sp.]
MKSAIDAASQDRWLDILRDRLGTDAPEQLTGVGNAALLDEPLLGLISSRECTGHVLLETLDRVPEWVQAGRVIVSGFHSPLEQQVLRSVLRRCGRAVKVLARGMTEYHPQPEEREPLAAGRMLVITAFAPSVTRTTRATSLARNRLVITLATEIVAPYIAPDSPLAALLSEMKP